jgi:hypothetical protein
MNVKIAGADQSITNLNTAKTHWQDTLQVAAKASRLFKASFSPLAGAVDIWVWVFDLAAGSASSAAPVAVRLVPAGYADTWDFGPDGSLFTNGIYLALSTTAPTDPTTTPAAAGNDKLLVKVDFRQGF